MVNVVLCHTLEGRLSAQGGPAYRASVADAAQARALGARSAGLLWAVRVKNGMGSKDLRAWGRESGETLLSWWLKGEDRPLGRAGAGSEAAGSPARPQTGHQRLLAPLLNKSFPDERSL